LVIGDWCNNARNPKNPEPPTHIITGGSREGSAGVRRQKDNQASRARLNYGPLGRPAKRGNRLASFPAKFGWRGSQDTFRVYRYDGAIWVFGAVHHKGLGCSSSGLLEASSPHPVTLQAMQQSLEPQIPNPKPGAASARVYA
jgi:hypothetical protein